MDRSTWQEAFQILCTDVPEFRYPEWFDYVAEQIPAEDSRARRDVPRFLSLLEAVALCRSFSDGRREKKKELEIDFGDYCVAFLILSEAFASTYLGAHPMALEFAKAVRHLYSKRAKPVTTSDVAEHLGWEAPVAHKWRVVAVRHKLIQYRPGTYQNNQKLLLPGPAKHGTTFLPAPRAVFRERPDIGNMVRYVDPITGQETVMRRQSEEDDET
jgi:hypothetical protein